MTRNSLSWEEIICYELPKQAHLLRIDNVLVKFVWASLEPQTSDTICWNFIPQILLFAVRQINVYSWLLSEYRSTIADLHFECFQ